MLRPLTCSWPCWTTVERVVRGEIRSNMPAVSLAAKNTETKSKLVTKVLHKMMIRSLWLVINEGSTEYFSYWRNIIGHYKIYLCFVRRHTLLDYRTTHSLLSAIKSTMINLITSVMGTATNIFIRASSNALH